jgi:hypothetical protein
VDYAATAKFLLSQSGVKTSHLYNLQPRIKSRTKRAMTSSSEWRLCIEDALSNSDRIDL